MSETRPGRSRFAITVIPVEGKAASPVLTSSTDEEAVEAAAIDVAKALATSAERWLGRTVARLRSPRGRKHSRHWTPEYEQDTRVGRKALDVVRIVDTAAWEKEAEAATLAILIATAADAATGLIADLAPDVQQPSASPAADVGPLVATAVAASALAQARSLAADLNEADQAGQPLEALLALVSRRKERLDTWAATTGAWAAPMAVESGRDAAAVWLTEQYIDQGAVRAAAAAMAATVAASGGDGAALPLQRIPATYLPTPGIIDTVLERGWQSKKDERVRPAHRAAHGQRVGLFTPFIVGAELLRFPGDPLGSPGNVRNCRCATIYRWRRSGRFAPRP